MLPVGDSEHTGRREGETVRGWRAAWPGRRLLHVPPRRRDGARCDVAWQRGALYQSLVHAELLLEGALTARRVCLGVLSGRVAV